MNSILKNNTADYYIYHLYKQYHNELMNRFSKLKEVTKLDIGTAYGSFQIDTKDVFVDESENKDLKFQYVGFGQVQFMGRAIYFNGKPLTNLYYKDKDIKDAIETFIKAVDIMDDDRRNTLKIIREQHGEPKVQYAILWDYVVNGK